MAGKKPRAKGEVFRATGLKLDRRQIMRIETLRGLATGQRNQPLLPTAWESFCDKRSQGIGKISFFGLEQASLSDRLSHHASKLSVHTFNQQISIAGCFDGTTGLTQERKRCEQ